MKAPEIDEYGAKSAQPSSPSTPLFPSDVALSAVDMNRSGPPGINPGSSARGRATRELWR